MRADGPGSQHRPPGEESSDGSWVDTAERIKSRLLQSGERSPLEGVQIRCPSPSLFWIIATLELAGLWRESLVPCTPDRW